MYCSYQFEANSIQGFVFSTGKLRDASGASDLLSVLAYEDHSEEPAPEDLPSASGRVADVLRYAELNPTIYRCAGGVLTILVPGGEREKLRQFRAVWRLVVEVEAPGLLFSDGIGEAGTAADAVEDARRACACARPRRIPEAPPGAPIMRMANRTDLPPAHVSGRMDDQARCKITQEYADRSTLFKRKHLEKGSLVLPKLFAGNAADQYKWPVAFECDESNEERHTGEEPFPFNHDRKRIALIHIDGNGVGQKFQALGEDGDIDLRRVSYDLAKATKRAVEGAMAKVVLPAVDGNKVVPARPILLGGDDLTIIVRADLAIPFTRAYVRRFEEKTRPVFGEGDVGKALETAGLDASDGLTAKAGIVYMGPKQPFRQAYELCETLAGLAKDDGTSKISFWRLVGAVIPQGRDELEEMTTANGKSLWRLSWTHDELEKLEELADVLMNDDIGRGPLRRIPELLLSEQEAADQAQDVYRRALDVLGERPTDAKARLTDAMAGLGVEKPGENIWAGDYTPLLDAHSLAQIRKGGTP